MNKFNPKAQGRKVPTSRLARLSKLGAFAAQAAGSVLTQKVKHLGKEQKPSTFEMLLHPKNIENLGDKLSQLRGAAMKVGQLLSMDAGDLLPAGLNELLAKLRSDAKPMAHKQLLQILKLEWSNADDENSWMDKVAFFDLMPFAQASIGQVHKADGLGGEKLAIKVQYPGVRESIESDVDNVALLLKMSNLLPAHIQLDELLEEAKQQLLNEADYQLEASYIGRYQQKLSNDRFVLPKVITPLCNQNMLAMTYIEGEEIDAISDLPQCEKNSVVEDLIRLFLSELFDMRLMQTDPNFANYLYQRDSKKIVLLDFGATREIPPTVSLGYQNLIQAAMDNNQIKALDAARQIGFFQQDLAPDEDYLNEVLSIFAIACEPLNTEGEYDFGRSDIASRIKDIGLSINRQKTQWHTPPVDAIFIHRKLAGLYLLAAKLDAKINLKHILDEYWQK